MNNTYRFEQMIRMVSYFLLYSTASVVNESCLGDARGYHSVGRGTAQDEDMSLPGDWIGSLNFEYQMTCSERTLGLTLFPGQIHGIKVCGMPMITSEAAQDTATTPHGKTPSPCSITSIISLNHTREPIYIVQKNGYCTYLPAHVYI
jgi:hypothetical protein